MQFGSSAYRPIPGTRVLTPEDAPDRAERRDFEDFGGDVAGRTPNSILQHPPLYYRITSLAVRAERFLLPGTGLPPLDREWSMLRLISVLMALPLPLIAWATARRIGAAEPVAIAASLVPLAIPQLLHTGSTITNDVLFNLCAAVLAFFLAGVLRGDRSVRTAVFVGLALGAALLTKAFGTVLVPWVAIAYVVGWRRHRTTRAAAVALGAAGLTAFVVAGWWWLRNVIRYGKLSPTPTDNTLTTALRPPGFEPSVGEWVGKFAPWIVERFWGWFGWFTARLDLPVIVLASVVALGRPGRRPAPASLGGADAPDPARVGGPAPAVGRAARVRGRALVQPLPNDERVRVHPGPVPARGGHPDRGRGGGRPPPSVEALGVPTLAGLALVMQVDAVWVMLRDWWAEPGAGLGRRLDAVLAWGPWPVGPPYLVALAVVATAAWTTFEIGARSGRAMRGEARPRTGRLAGRLLRGVRCPVVVGSAVVVVVSAGSFASAMAARRYTKTGRRLSSLRRSPTVREPTSWSEK